jgi:hypothetical protein
MLPQHVYQIVGPALIFVCLLWAGADSSAAQTNPNDAAGANAVYLPLVASGADQVSEPTLTSTPPTATANPVTLSVVAAVTVGCCCPPQDFDLMEPATQ